MATTEQTPAFDPQAVFGELIKLLRMLNPALEGAEVIYRGGGIEGVLPVPTIPEQSKPKAKLTPEVARAADSIVAALRLLSPGETIDGADLMADIEIRMGEELSLSTFNRAVRHLKEDGKLPAQNKTGYRLKA